MDKMKVAFICVHNSCRSQMAEALCGMFAGDVLECYSAGTQVVPEINQQAVRTVKKMYGIDMSAQKSKLLENLPAVDIVITMGCDVECPMLAGQYHEDWGLQDPTGKPEKEFEKTAKEIENRICLLRKKVIDKQYSE